MLMFSTWLILEAVVCSLSEVETSNPHVGLQTSNQGQQNNPPRQQLHEHSETSSIRHEPLSQTFQHNSEWQLEMTSGSLTL